MSVQKPLKLCTVFRRAAEIVASGRERYSCDAIHRASGADKVGVGGRAPGALLCYRELFTPAVDSPEHYWLRGTEMTEDESHQWRITALCFAAAIAKSENR